jgi:hypothetical protein
MPDPNLFDPEFIAATGQTAAVVGGGLIIGTAAAAAALKKLLSKPGSFEGDEAQEQDGER